MNITKGDVLELRRRLKKTECTFGRMCGCYVNSGKQVVLKFSESFSELEEDDCFLPNQTAIEDIPLKEGEVARKIMVRVKLLPDSE